MGDAFATCTNRQIWGKHQQQENNQITYRRNNAVETGEGMLEDPLPSKTLR